MNAETIPRQFLESVNTYDKKDAFRYKTGGRYVDVSHREMLDKVHNAAVGLQALKLAKGDRVGLISENRLEWAVADLAALSAGCITVPVYPTLPANQVEYVLRDAETRVVFVSDDDQLAKVLACRDRVPSLQHIVTFGQAGDHDGVLSLEALIQRGEMQPDKPVYKDMIATIGKLDWASIIYTSGTTGEPKGAILTHWNFMSNVHTIRTLVHVGPGDTCLSFLPLSHVFERTAGYYFMITAGITIAYVESVEKVPDNMREIGPSVMCSVPRLYEKIYARILATVEAGPPLKQKVFHWAVKTGRQYVAEKLAGRVGFGTARKKAVADALVFKKLQARTGGHLRFFVSGGAPLSREINEFFFAAGIPILEGYGLTETSPVLTVNTFENFRFGTVGQPIPGVEIRIADDGEILARGDNIMVGYYKKPAETAEVLKDGWFHTGDIGALDEDGYLTITDRKKEILVTAGGKNVAPAPIENRIKDSKYVDEAVLVGNTRRFIAALIVPNIDALEQFALTHHIAHTTVEELVNTPEVHELITSEIERTCAEFASFECVKKFAILEDAFTIETGELTPSLKVKRRVVEKKFAGVIEALYAK